MTQDTVLTAHGLGKRYRRRWALSDCTVAIPAGRVVGLVGPNGAGKTTLMRLAAGLIAPSAGTVEVMGAPPAQNPAQLAKVGFVAQDTPTYANLSIADHLRLGGWLNDKWDRALAEQRIDKLGLDPRQRAGKLSGGQRAQLALTMAIAKRPELLLLDEPVASLDPLARRDFMQGIGDIAAEHRVSVILSSHLVADLERVCDYVIVLVASRVRVAGAIDDLLASHYRLTGPRAAEPGTTNPGATLDLAGAEVIEQRHDGEHSTLLVRSDVPIDHPSWKAEPVSLEDVVLAYMAEEARS
jgi:ABC-2 type transport system ATP-binding protein